MVQSLPYQNRILYTRCVVKDHMASWLLLLEGIGRGGLTIGMSASSLVSLYRDLVIPANDFPV